GNGGNSGAGATAGRRSWRLRRRRPLPPGPKIGPSGIEAFRRANQTSQGASGQATRIVPGTSRPESRRAEDEEAGDEQGQQRGRRQDTQAGAVQSRQADLTATTGGACRTD